MSKISYRIDSPDKRGFCAIADDGGNDIGLVCAAVPGRRKAFAVFSTEIDASYRKQGIATKLYEMAAKEACKRGMPLHSDVLRSEMIEPFWAKQARKKRARLVKYKRKIAGHEVTGDYYALRCPAPRSLARSKK